MLTLVYLFGLFIIISGVVLVGKPAVIVGFLQKHSENIALYISAIAVRIILGCLLIYTAHLSHYPLVIMVIGWISLLAGVALAFMGQNRFKQLLVWGFAKIENSGRLIGVLGVCFGLFLIYAFF